MNNRKFSFGKEEKLCSRKRITEVFTKGRVVFNPPLRVSFISKGECEEPSMFLISVPKRNFKKAVLRNRIKRLIRESIRLNKEILSESQNKFDICIVYSGNKMPTKDITDTKIKDVLGQIKENN